MCVGRVVGAAATREPSLTCLNFTGGVTCGAVGTPYVFFPSEPISAMSGVASGATVPLSVSDAGGSTEATELASFLLSMAHQEMIAILHLKSLCLKSAKSI